LDTGVSRVGGSLSGTVCAIIGGGGFLGANLAMALKAEGAEVRAYGRTRYFDAPLANVRWMSGKLDDLQNLSILLMSVDVVFHLAGALTPASAEANRTEDVNASVLGTIHLLDLCRELSVNRVVFASSGGTIYGNATNPPFAETVTPQPISTYGINKLAAEQYLRMYNRSYGMKNVILRIANPFGPYQHELRNQGIVSIFLRKALSGEPLKIWGDGSFVRDYVFGGDVAQAMIAAARYQGDKTVFNVGSGVGRSINDVVRDLGEVLGHEIQCEYSPARGFDVPVSVLDCRLAAEELEWSATSDWLTALRTTRDWISQEFAQK